MIQMNKQDYMSRFICLKCGELNGIEIIRKQQREKLHIKDLTCNSSKCNGRITHHVEVRGCDWLDDIKMEVPNLHNQYYGLEEGMTLLQISGIDPEKLEYMCLKKRVEILKKHGLDPKQYSF